MGRAEKVKIAEKRKPKIKKGKEGSVEDKILDSYIEKGKKN